MLRSVGDAATVLSARQTREQIENRLHNWMSVGTEMRHKPGDDGISSFDARSFLRCGITPSTTSDACGCKRTQ